MTSTPASASAASTSATSGDATDASKPASGDLGLLEEDDDFEEFALAASGNKASAAAVTSSNGHASEDEESAAWEDTWDDDTVEDDFAVQLKRYARKRTASSRSRSPPMRSPEPVAKKRCSRSSPQKAAAAPEEAMQVDEQEQTPPQVSWMDYCSIYAHIRSRYRKLINFDCKVDCFNAFHMHGITPAPSLTYPNLT